MSAAPAGRRQIFEESRRAVHGSHGHMQLAGHQPLIGSGDLARLFGEAAQSINGGCGHRQLQRRSIFVLIQGITVPSFRAVHKGLMSHGHWRPPAMTDSREPVRNSHRQLGPGVDRAVGLPEPYDDNPLWGKTAISWPRWP